MHRTPIALLASLLISACAGDLHDRHASAPNTGFAAEQRRALNAPESAAEPAQEATLAPKTDDPPGRDTEAVPTRGDALAEAGFGVDRDAMKAVQDDAWRPATTLSHADARLAFLARNPGVGAALTRHRAAQTRYTQLQHLSDLVHQYDAFSAELRTHASTPHTMPEGVSWPLRGTLALQGALADVDVTLSLARLQRDVLSALVRFEDAFQDAHLQDRTASILDTNITLAKQAQRVAESRYRAGRGEYAHVLLAENRVDTLRAQRDAARERHTAALDTLAALLDLPHNSFDPNTRLTAPTPALPPRDTLADDTADSPDVTEAHAIATRSALLAELVERQLLPDISPGLSFTRDGSSPRRAADLMYTNRAPFLAEMQLVAEAAAANQADITRSAPARADAAWTLLSSALRDYELHSGPLRKRARQAADAASDAYRAGSLSYATLDDTLTRVLEHELAAAQRLRDAFIARARLHTLTGPY